MTHMKVVLGSTSDIKIQILKDTLQPMSRQNLEISGVEVASGIADQPLDETTTIQGAINRAKNALSKTQGYDFAVGLEGGLHDVVNTGYFLICAAAIYDKTNHLSLGIGGKLQLPVEVSSRIKAGEQFGVVIREYEQKHQTNPQALLLIQALISREKAFKQAIQNAYLAYKNKHHFSQFSSAS